ncbi:hypothetical protein RBA41_22000 [Massilia sp. CCM 9210]|uniref:hypothetical protein n=1 Tax=Massilia scottii TaxID=3057166 RepID=UPI0027968A9C|nr:hypothetical protein [Massilia sp. CCM 9210]MDQ1815974.1 hypothetical protein [Massilia sp. CCM 9210]
MQDALPPGAYWQRMGNRALSNGGAAPNRPAGNRSNSMKAHADARRTRLKSELGKEAI